MEKTDYIGLQAYLRFILIFSTIFIDYLLNHVVDIIFII